LKRIRAEERIDFESKGEDEFLRDGLGRQD
jgi:hypothetical protein